MTIDRCVAAVRHFDVNLRRFRCQGEATPAGRGIPACLKLDCPGPVRARGPGEFARPARRRGGRKESQVIWPDILAEHLPVYSLIFVYLIVVFMYHLN